MTYGDLFSHELKKGLRSKAFYKNLFTNILYGLFGVYMLGVLLFTGFFLDRILEEVSNEYNPTELILRGLIYIILLSVTLRFLMQQLSTVAIQNYLTLPVKRSKLIHFLLLKPLINPVNYFSLLLIVPLAIRSTAAYYDGFTAFRFVLLIIFVMWFDSFLTAFLKRKFGMSIWGILAIILCLGGVFALDYFKLVPFSDWSSVIFEFALFSPFGLIIPLTLVAIAYGLNLLYFRQNYYLDTFNRSTSDSTLGMNNLSFLDRFGKLGSIIELEIKLILRHKRTKQVLYTTGFFLLYGLIFYPRMELYEGGMLFFAAIFITGFMMFLFGQWLIAWDGMYFDGMMTQNISAREYIEANYYLMSGFCILSFILTTPYFFFGMKIVYLHVAALMVNLGLNVFFYVFLATYNTKPLDLSKGNTMNTQGMTIKNFLVIFPVIVLPWGSIALLNLFFSFEISLLIMGMLGFVGLLFHKQLLNICVKQFQRRKYLLAESYRESE